MLNQPNFFVHIIIILIDNMYDRFVHIINMKGNNTQLLIINLNYDNIK